MFRSNPFLYLLLISIVFATSGFAQVNPVSENFVNNHELKSDTYSYRVLESNCNTGLTPTGTYYDMTNGWDSSPYTEGHITYKPTGAPKMNYRLLYPIGYDSSYSEGYPMIIMLHGFGERANCWGNNCYYPNYNESTNYPLSCSDTLGVNVRFRNNDHNLAHGGKPHLNAVNLAGSLKAEDPSLPERAFPGFVMFPQNMNGWGGQDINYAYIIIRHLIDSLNIDPNRVYVHGLSNGGEGTWKIFQTYPTLFAAALVMSGDFTPNNVDTSTVYHPLWLFQGGRDTKPSPAETASRIKKYEDAGGIVRYTEYPTLGHGTWNSAYAEPDFFSWILKQNKANMHVYYGDSSFCSTVNNGVRLGVAKGFKAYQWKKDGEILPDSIDEDIIVYEPGIYEVRFSRVSTNPTSESEWNRWSDPVEIKERSADTPSIYANGTTILPDINSQDSVYLFAPKGYGTYEWFKDSNPIGIDTSFLKLSGTNDAGEYSLIVKTLDGCPSLESESVSVLNNAPIDINIPQNFVATPISSTSIRLSWQVNSQNEQGFEIYRTTTSGANYSFVALVDAGELSLLDSTLTPSTTYYYEIRAISNTARSDYYSPEISATTLDDQVVPFPPQNLTVLSRTVSSVTLSWDPSQDNSYIEDYYIYYGSDSISTSGSTEFTVPDLTINSYFTFTVKAVDGGGEFSAKSDPVYATTTFNGLHYEHSTGAWNSLAEIDWNFVEFSGDINNFDISGTTQFDFFNFKFDGYIFIPSDGNYTFYTISDDGSRLYLDGFDQNNLSTNLLVDNDGKHGSTEKNGTINLTAGPHLITVLFFEYTGGQNLLVKWEGPGITKQLIPDSVLNSGTLVTNPAPEAPSSLVAMADTVDPSINLNWDYLGEQPENLNIVVLGSSTAEGTGASSYSTSWVGQLDTWLSANTIGHTLTNLAQGGFETYDIRATGSTPAPNDTSNITAALALDPDIILINLPSNNVASNVPITTTMDHYREIKALADAAGVQVYITTTQPRNFGNDSTKRALLEEEADSVRANFGDFVIDIYDSLTDFTNDRKIKSIYNYDGIHVNDLGHTYIYNTVLNTLRKHLTNFQIYRSFTSGGPYQLLSNTIDGEQSYVDEGLVPDSTYYYVVRTVNLNGVSSNSNESSATVIADSSPPTDPTNLTYVATNFTQASLAWDASLDNILVAGYEIYRDNILIDTSFTESYIATELLPTHTYDFKVRAYDLGGNFSGYSNVINVSTTGATTFYLKPSGTIIDISSWDTAMDGSAGVAPINFTNNGQYFVITNQTPAVLNSDWAVSGEVSKVIVENGEEFDVESNFTGFIEGKAGSTVNLNSVSSPSFINMDYTSTVNFDSLGTLIPKASYGNVNLTGGGTTKNFEEGVTEVRGSLTCGTGIILKGKSNNSSVLKIGGNLTMANPGFTSTDNRLTIDFNGSSSQSFITDGNLKLYSLKAENGSDATLNMQPGGAITLGTSLGGGIGVASGSTLDLSGINIKITGEGTINSGNETGQIGLNNSVLEFATTPSFNSNIYPIAGKDSLLLIDYDVTPTTELVIQGELDIKNYINVNQGVVNSNGYLKLLSTSDTTSAYVKSFTSGSQITGDVTVQRHMDGEGKLWRHLSSPVSGATVDQLQEDIPITGLFDGASTGFSSNPSMYSYDDSQVGNEWINFPPDGGDSTEVLVSGRGYVVWVREGINATVAEVAGPLHQGDLVFPTLIGDTSGLPEKGWNLVGNPYASPVQWNPVDNSKWSVSGISNTIAVWDGATGNGGYIYWDGSVGSLKDGIIAPWQGFWVQSTNASPGLMVTENAKYDSLGASYYRTSEDIHYVEISLSDGEKQDLAYIKFTTESIDEYSKNEDAYKRLNEYFNLSSLSDDSVALAINVVNEMYCSKTIQINIGDTEPGHYVMSFDLSNAIKYDESYALYDKYLEDTIDLNLNSTYEFDVTTVPETFNTRFELIVKKGAIDKTVVVTNTEYCEDEDLNELMLNGSQFGVDYSVKYGDGTYSTPVRGTGAQISISLDTNKVVVGKSTLGLMAGYPTCAIEDVGSFEIDRVELLDALLVKDQLVICKGDDAVIYFDQLPEESSYRYYLDSALTDYVDFTGTEYVLNSLDDGVKARFSAVNRLGCAGSVSEVDINISALLDPLLMLEGDTLVSNYGGINVWYLDDFIIDDISEPKYVPIETGVYMVSASEGQCVKYSNDVSYLINGVDEMSDNSGVSIYPNPVDNGGYFYLSGKDFSKVTKVVILSDKGDLISNCNYQIINNNKMQLSPSTKKLSNGFYLLFIQFEDRVSVKKFMLKD